MSSCTYLRDEKKTIETVMTTIMAGMIVTKYRNPYPIQSGSMSVMDCGTSSLSRPTGGRAALEFQPALRFF